MSLPNTERMTIKKKKIVWCLYNLFAASEVSEQL